MKFLRSMQLFQVLNCIWRTRGIEGRIEAVVNQPRGWIFHPPIRGELGHERKTNVREYTQRDFDSARGAIEQLPDHLSISSESAPVCLGESVHRVLLASPNRSQVKASLPLTLPLSILFFPYFSSSNSFFLPAVLPWNKNSSARRKIERKIRRSFPCPITLLSSLFCSIFLTRNEYFPPLFFFLLLMFIQCSRKFLRATTKPSPRNYSRNAKTLVVSRGLSHRSRTIGRRETRTECNRRARGEIIVSFHPIPIILSLVYGGLLISRDERAIHPKGIQRLDRGFKERLSRNRTNLSRGQPDDSNGESKLSRSKEN